MQHFLIFAAILLFASCKQPSFSERYKGDWHSPRGDEFITIGRSLVKNNIGDCGEYYVRESSMDKGEYVVGCTNDGAHFNYYVVWTSTEKVMTISSSEIDKAPERE